MRTLGLIIEGFFLHNIYVLLDNIDKFIILYSMLYLKKPILDAPRFRKKSKSYLTLAVLDKLKTKYPKYKDMSLQEFKKIIQTFNAHIAEGFIENRNGIELQEGLGTIFMGTCKKSKKSMPNYGGSLASGVIQVHQNWETDNKLMKIFYTNHNAKYGFSNKEVWSFKANKEVRKKASIAYKENWIKYIEVPPQQKVSTFFTKNKPKSTIDISEDYDEFKM